MTACALAIAAAVVPAAGVRAQPAEPHVGCAQRSSANFPQAFSNPNNVVAGPLAWIGAGGYASERTIRAFGGEKFPVLVKAGHSVTLSVDVYVDAAAAPRTVMPQLGRRCDSAPPSSAP